MAKMMLEVPEELNGMVAALRDVGDRFPGVDYFEDDLSQSFDETPDFSRFFVDMLREDIRRREEGIWQLPRWATSAIRIIGPLVLDFVPFVSQAMTATNCGSRLRQETVWAFWPQGRVSFLA